jgi:hypothetical protein
VAKFEIALQAIKNETPLNDLCKKYEVSPRGACVEKTAVRRGGTAVKIGSCEIDLLNEIRGLALSPTLWRNFLACERLIFQLFTMKHESPFTLAGIVTTSGFVDNLF